MLLALGRGGAAPLCEVAVLDAGTSGDKTMKKSFPLPKVYGLLEPGPVVLVTTAQKGRANVMTLSWLTMMDFKPPLIGMVMSDRNYSFAALKATRQCVI